MLFRQFFEPESCTYTYLVGAPNGDAVIVDPVRSRLDQYLRAVRELGLKIVAAVDTHVHADHVTAIGPLADATGCRARLPERSRVPEADAYRDGEDVGPAGVPMKALSTPGHTDDSCCLVMIDRVLTGDTLLIRATGRTDFQHGDSAAAWTSLQKLLTLPDETLVYPAHDYKGWTVSTIGEERRCNPRLQVGSAAAYAELMVNLKLPYPDQIEVAIPANRRLGRNA